MWKACKTMGPPPKTMPQKVMPPSLVHFTWSRSGSMCNLFVVAPWFVFGVVIRCAMKLLPCKIFGDARKSRQHVVFERCPERCPNDARPDGSRPAKSSRAKLSCRITRSCPANAGPALPSMLPHAPRARQPSNSHCLLLWCYAPIDGA